MKYLTNIDLNKNELQNARIQNLATAPQNPVEGQIYYNTSDKATYQWNGTEWKTMGGDLPIASSSVLGGVKVGGGLSVEADGTLSTDIQTIKVNGVAQTPDENKAVDLLISEVAVANDGSFSFVDNRKGATKHLEAMFQPSGDGKELAYAVDGASDFDIMYLATTDYVNTNKASLKILENPAGPTGTEHTAIIAQGTDSVSFNYIKQDGSTLPDYINANIGSDDFMLATKDYVDSTGGKIDAIKVNNVTQPITNKTVDIDVVALDWEADRAKIMKAGGLSSAIQFIDDANGVELSFGKGSASSQTFVYKTLVDKAYVDGTFRTEQQVQAAIDASLADITGIDFQVVTELPATGEKGVIYLLANSGTTPNTYDEYIWVTPEGGTAHYEKIGTTDVDLSNYPTKTEVNSLITETTGTIETTATSVSVSYSGILLDAYAIQNGEKVIVDTAITASAVTFSCASSPVSAVTCKVVAAGTLS